VIPTFHPAAILHGGGERSRQFAELREDFELIRDTLAELRRPPAPAPQPVTVPETGSVPEEQLELF
jgi:hypothetical protein